MNLNVTHSEVGVPPRCPPHLTTVPLYPVREHQRHTTCNVSSLVPVDNNDADFTSATDQLLLWAGCTNLT